MKIIKQHKMGIFLNNEKVNSYIQRIPLPVMLALIFHTFLEFEAREGYYIIVSSPLEH